jgi:hypothetical protein
VIFRSDTAVRLSTSRPPLGGELGRTIVQVVIGGAIVFAIGVWLGRIGAS